MQTTEKLAALRAKMRDQKVDAVLVLSADPHLSEYLPDGFKAREWLSGFTGSVGTLIVTQDFAGLWVDSRYWVMAEKQLRGSGIEMQKWHNAETSYQHWLEQNLQKDQVLAVSGETISLENAHQLQKILAKKQARLEFCDLVSAIWQDRPPLPLAPLYLHPAAFCGAAYPEKCQKVRAMMQQQNADWLLLSALDDIAWLLNLRGSDVNYNPVFLAHCLVGLNEVILCVDEQKITPEIHAYLQENHIQRAPYPAIDQLLAEKINAHETLMLDCKKVTISTLAQLPAAIAKKDHINPTTLLKSQKTDFEIAQIRNSMVQDGIALATFFAWLEDAQAQKATISELTIAEKLTEFRSPQDHYVSDSFGTIAGFNSNGAMPHYSATADDFAMIEGDGLLLIDSGGQYLNGTTDITRVVAIGKVSAEQKRDYTLVLKAHIALASTVFPDRTCGQLLDSIGRSALWKSGINYGHGTGHGVGYFLNVHEGPQVISYLSPIGAHSALLKGNFLSNEPGIYRPNQWGVRLENLMIVQPFASNEFGDFMHFETVTLCPFDQSCIEKELLNADEVQWLNQYHQTVFDALSTHLTGAPLAWLKKQTQAI